MKLFFIFSLTLLLFINVFAVDGFREFAFGDDTKTVMEKGRRLCRFGEVQKDTRWKWKTYLSCTSYQFKKETRVKLFFHFSDDKLVKIYVVSKDIDNYFLIRYPEHNYLVPLIDPKLKKRTANLVDKLVLQDKVHTLGKEYQYTTFFYQGKWEWEYLYEDPRNKKRELKKREVQLKEEAEGGVKGWKKFNFNESDETIKEKLKGMCSSISVFSVGQDKENLICHEFTFTEKKIDLIFLFYNAGLVKIELKLEQEWYQKLLPLLKRKYGKPYVELTQNMLYFPYIEFTKANVVLSYKRNESKNRESWVSLKYLREGYLDGSTPLDNLKLKFDRDGKSEAEEILDNI